jgi:hypothetical protein
MKVLDVEGLATHNGPESCVTSAGNREHEALTGVRVGRVLSREIHEPLRSADPLEERGRQHRLARYREDQPSSARSPTPSMRASTSCGSREIPRLTRADGARARKGNLREEGYRR